MMHERHVENVRDATGEPAAPRLIAWELTRHCPMHCRHCRAAARSEPDPAELSTDECLRLLDNIASFARPLLILTGGEPMLRSDLHEIARYAASLGLRVALAPCGLMLDERQAARIKQSGIAVISLPVDGASAATHDAFRGYRGSFDACMRAVEAARRVGLPFQINTTVCRSNVEELPGIIDLATRLGAVTFNPFLLVPTGRGSDLAGLELSPQDYERTLRWLAERTEDSPVPIRVTCAPHYQRVLAQSGRGDGGDQALRGCLGGKTYAFISHLGKVQPCGFLELECGDLRQVGMDFRRIWDTSDVLARLRDVDGYGGRCGYCEFRRICGGCRARAYAVTGDYLAEEPYCTHQSAAPHPALDDVDGRVLWRVQSDLPLVRRPFEPVAHELGLEPAELLERLQRLHARRLIRRFGPVFDSGRLGYVSTLVAARVPPERIGLVVPLVNALPGVTHHYAREHELNLWFTLTMPGREAIGRALAELRDRTGIEFHSLPALRRYKLGVRFALPGAGPPPHARTPRPRGPAALSREQKNLVRAIQEGLPLTEEPFAGVARRLGLSVDRLLAGVRDLLAEGIIRRFGVLLDHRRLGYVANGMAVFRVEDSRADEVGHVLAARQDVTHCYLRATAPGWPYNLFAMMHGRRREDVRAAADRLAAELGVAEHEVLFSVAEYKRTTMKYFVEADWHDRRAEGTP